MYIDEVMPQLLPVQVSEPSQSGLMRSIQSHRDSASQCTELQSKWTFFWLIRAVDVQPGVKDIELTERHLVDEAEVTLHHLGPGQLRRWVNGNPVEPVRPQGVAVKSRVIGVWSLNGQKATTSMSSNEWRDYS